MEGLLKKRLIQRAIFQQFTPERIQEMIDGPDSVTVALRDGSLFLAQLDEYNSLHLKPIDTTC